MGINEFELKELARERVLDSENAANAPLLHKNLTKSEDGLLLELQHDIRIGIYSEQRMKKAGKGQSFEVETTNTRSGFKSLCIEGSGFTVKSMISKCYLHCKRRWEGLQLTKNTKRAGFTNHLLAAASGVSTEC